MIKTATSITVGIALLVVLLGGCKRDYTSDRNAAPENRVGELNRDRQLPATPNAGQDTLAPSATASAQLRPTQGGGASGTARFASTADGVRVTIDMTGLAPGKHEIFVHPNSDCTMVDDESGATGTNSVQADSAGRAHGEFIDSRLALDGQTSIVGRTVVIQEDAEPAADEPGEEADADVACGVIIASRP